MLEQKNFIGCRFYHLEDGKLVYTYGFNQQGVLWYTYDYKEHGVTPVEQCLATWTSSDLKDFPEYEDNDPKLPYDFDLLWDIKRVSQLLETLYDDKDTKMEILFEALKGGQFKFHENPVENSPLDKLKKMVESHPLNA